jgi:hypothetical protein
VSLYKRGGIWWCKFKFEGNLAENKSGSRPLARDAERARRRELETAFNRIPTPDATIPRGGSLDMGLAR